MDFSPPEGKTLLIIGQDKYAIQDYVQQIGDVPAGFMSYTSIQLLEGLDLPSPDGYQYAKPIISNYPGTVLQIGLWMVDALDGINQGDFDKNIDRLADWVKKAERPIYLRIGYEFDYPDNRYEPQAYVKAFCRIVARFRTRGVDNAAFVWHSYANKTNHPLLDWYPGDDYVDWVGVSYFSPIQQPYLEAVAKVAQERGKPLMIAESAPMGMTVWPGEDAWKEWFAPYFKFISDHAVKAVCYINCDWDSIPMFAKMNWGDSRLHVQKDIKANWMAEIAHERYIHASDGVYSQIGY